MKFIVILSVLLTSACSTMTKGPSDFDKWYEAVINEPYDPINGSKY